MEVKFASNKKGPKQAPKQAPEKPPQAAPEPPPPKAGGSGEEQFKKLMPIAIIGLIVIAALLIYIARRSPSGTSSNSGTKVATAGSAGKGGKLGLSGLRRPSRPTLQRPTLGKPSLGGWRNRLFARRRPAPAQATPRSPRRVAVAGSRGGTPRRAAPRQAAATPSAAVKPKFCLIFGAIKASNRKFAQSDIRKMAKRMRGMIWPAKLQLRTKPCCKVVLGPYEKGKRQKAIGHFNRLKRHYRGLSLSEYNGLLDEIFPAGSGWESCP